MAAEEGLDASYEGVVVEDFVFLFLVVGEGGWFGYLYLDAAGGFYVFVVEVVDLLEGLSRGEV